MERFEKLKYKLLGDCSLEEIEEYLSVMCKGSNLYIRCLECDEYISISEWENHPNLIQNELCTDCVDELSEDEEEEEEEE